jgi:polar amino acid transport system substrate-binding protein
MGCRANGTGWSEDAEMSRDHRDERRRQRREAIRARRAQRRAGYGWEPPDPDEGRDARVPATPEERALREARAEANRMIGFMSHLVPYLTVVTFLAFVANLRVAGIVGLAWGIGVASHFFGAIVAPRMHKRIVEREVTKRVHADVSRERRTLVDAHTRHVEELAAGVAHEIRNPITAAKSLVQQMGEDPTARENVEYAGVALAELERVERSISHLLRFAREEDIALGELRIGEVVDASLATLADRCAGLGVTVEKDVAAVRPLRGDPEKLRRVLINLIGNALDAFADAKTQDPRLTIQAGENLAGTEAWLRVRDNGPGMDAERLGKIWSPFYTSKTSGTGLGLALSRKVIEAHGGSIEAGSAPGEGTEFLITLPRAANGGGEAR